jgi:hypothetical protein
MELCLTGLFFLVRDTDGKAACTAQAIIMIFATGLTGLFHCTLNHGHKLHWLPFVKDIKQPVDQIGNEGKTQWNRRYCGILIKGSAVSPERSPSQPYQDEALTSARPVIWIPKDELGVADDEINHIRKTYNSIWISNEGASLDAQGRLRVWGDLPALSD